MVSGCADCHIHTVVFHGICGRLAAYADELLRFKPAPASFAEECIQLLVGELMQMRFMRQVLEVFRTLTAFFLLLDSLDRHDDFIAVRFSCTVIGISLCFIEQ